MRVSAGSATSITGAITVNTVSNYALETGGNLATIAGSISGSVMQGNIAKFGGSAVTLGQQLAANSIPVILPSATIITLTPPSNTGYALDSSLSTIDSDIKSNITLHAGSNVIGHVIVDSGAITVNTISGFALESGGNLDAIETDIDTLVATVTASLDTTSVPSQSILVSGESNDGTPQYNPIPLGTAGRSVIVEGVSGGQAMPVVLNAETTKVIGTVNQGTSPWVIAGGKTNNNAAPGATNVGALIGIANAAQQTWSEGDQVLMSSDLKGNTRIRISDAAGNDRGANVNASNQLSVSVDNTPAVTVSGVATATNQISGAQKAETVDSYGNVASENSTTTSTMEVILGAVTDTSGSNPATFTPGGGATDILDELNATVNQPIATSYNVKLSTGSYNASWTIENVHWGAQMGAFKLKATNSFSVVQSRKTSVAGTITSGQVTLAFNSNLTAGNMIWVAIAVYTGQNNATELSNSSVPTDTLSHTYVGVDNEVVFNSSQTNFEHLRCFYVPNCKAGANTVTVNLDNTTASGGQVTIVITEVAGIITTSPLDVVSSALSNANSTAANTGSATISAIAYGQDVNITSILGTRPTAAGKIDVKGADGDIFVRQATGTNLHAVIDSGTVTANTNLVPSGASLNTYSVQITTNTTTTPTSSTAYISSIAIVSAVGGTGSTVTVQDKQGTPLKLVDGLVTTAVTTTPNVINFQTPIKMVSGIDIVTGGAVAATVNIWVNYFQ